MTYRWDDEVAEKYRQLRKGEKWVEEWRAAYRFWER